jgi:hypothetical protein
LARVIIRSGSAAPGSVGAIGAVNGPYSPRQYDTVVR